MDKLVNLDEFLSVVQIQDIATYFLQRTIKILNETDKSFENFFSEYDQLTETQYGVVNPTSGTYSTFDLVPYVQTRDDENRDPYVYYNLMLRFNIKYSKGVYDKASKVFEFFASRKGDLTSLFLHPIIKRMNAWGNSIKIVSVMESHDFHGTHIPHPKISYDLTYKLRIDKNRFNNSEWVPFEK